MTDKGKIITIAHCQSCGKTMAESVNLTFCCQNRNCSLYKKEYVVLPARLVEKPAEANENDNGV